MPLGPGAEQRNGPSSGGSHRRIREGNYGDVDLSGLNVVGVLRFEGNIWDEDTRMDAGLVLDERADERQREALQTVFGGQAGGWPKVFADTMVGNLLGLEFAPIELEISDDSELVASQRAGQG